MGGKALLVMLAGVMMISVRIFLSITGATNDITANAEQAFLRQAAKNISQTGVNLGLRQLANTPSWRTGFPLMNMMLGKVLVTAKDTTYSGKPVVMIKGVGFMEYGSSLEWRDISIAYVSKGGFVPATVKAAVTTANPVSTLGNLTVDGEDHSNAGALISGQGTLGIWTTKTLSQSGNSKIGGYAGGVSYTPSKPGNANSYATNQTWPGGYPGTPDSILGGASNGYPEGYLKSMAQSGANGSQYTTDPGTLTTPFKGVTYVELPSGSTWQSMSIQGSGILIVHNSARNAIMKNLNSGTFTGLMIVDDPVHIHTSIIGALIGLTPTPSEGNCIGNGNGSVLYSSQAIIDATSGGSGSSGNGSASNVLAWWE
jgi:hypothetical protein